MAHRFSLPVVLCSLFVLAAAPVIAADRPNIILCMADDQGWGDTAYNGHPVLKTPHLDAMAAVGLRFDHFHAAAPVCSPTRGSVMTGRHPNRYGVFKWGHPMRPQEITIAARLQRAGYATGHFGKWHLGSVLKGSPVNPAAFGFDCWLSAPNFYDNDPILSREGKAVQLQGESSIIAADAAIDFIREQVSQSKPFLAVVWFGSPHSPHHAVEEDRRFYADQGKNADWLGEITGLDRAVGKLRAELRKLHIQDNTLFWYTSDNGGLQTASSGGRGKKGSVYQGGLRVPAIIEWPARIKEPRITQNPANTCDIHPTLLDLLDIDVDVDNDRPLDGISLAETIDGKQDVRSQPMGFWDYAAPGIKTPSAIWMAELLEAQQAGKAYHDESRLCRDAGEITKTYPHDKFPGHSAWLDWPWKLHRIDVVKKQNKKKKGDNPPADQAAAITIELYDLADDPMETTDLAAQNPDRVKKMRAELERWLGSVVDSLNGDDYR